MNYKVALLTSALCLLTSTSTYAYSADSESTRSPGWYAGISTSVVNIGGNVVITSNQNVDDAFDVDTSDAPLTLKAGYITENENRIEVYYKDDSIGVKDSELEDAFKISSFGVNYQWGFSSLSSEKMIPYLRVGGGIGSAKDKGASADLTAVEFDMGAGVYYDFTDNLGMSAGVYRRAVVVSNDSADSLGFAMNGAEIGVNYYTY